jgi:hypothetical protein
MDEVTLDNACFVGTKMRADRPENGRDMRISASVSRHLVP